MMRQALTKMCLAAAVLAAPGTAASAASFTSLTVFGDSLVDAGNIRALGLGANPAQGYFQGRFTNGYDYTDLLSYQLFGTATKASLKGGTNFAYGGARATTTSGVPDLAEQIVQFDAYLAGGKSVDPTGLYVLNFGGNDVFAAAQPGVPAGYASDAAFLEAAAGAYAQGVQDLVDRGARNIFITGFPVATPGPGLDASLVADGYLTTALGDLNLTADTTLYRYSYLSFFQRLQADPAAFGLPPLILPDPTSAATLAATTCRGQRAWPDCTGYFSFDGTHPTAAVHQALFRDINAQFNLSSVPEPATWALMILGFGAVGAAMRRRATVRARVRLA